MFFSRVTKFEYACVYDIGSDSVTVAYVQYDTTKKEKPLVLWVEQKSLSNIYTIKKEAYGPKLLLKETILQATRDAEVFRKKVHLDRPIKTHVTFGAPWYTSESHHEKIHYKEPVLFTRTDFAEVITKVAALLEQKTGEKDASLKAYFSAKPFVMEQHLTNMKINEYIIEDPFDKPLRDLTLDFFLTVIPEDIHTYITETLDDTWGDIQVTFSSFSLTHYAVARSKMEPVRNALFVDVTGAVTECASIREGAISNVTNIPLGRAHFRKIIEEQYGLDSFMANSLLDMYARKELSVRESGNLNFALTETEKKWKESIKQILLEEKELNIHTTQIVLSTDPQLQNYFDTLLRQVMKESEDKLLRTSQIAHIEHYNELVAYIDPSMKHAFISLSVLYMNAHHLQ